MSDGEQEACVVERSVKLFPGRDAQARILYDALGQPGQPSPALVHLHDANSATVSKQLLYKALATSTILVELDALVCPTSHSLFAHFWTAIRTATTFAGPTRLDDSLDAFLDAVSTWINLLRNENRKLVIVLPRAERIRDTWPESIIEALFTMPRRVDARGFLTLITLSTLPASQFRTTRGIGLHDAVVVPFPRLSKDDTLTFLHRDAEVVAMSDNRQVPMVDSLIRLHSTFVAVVYDSFSNEVRDLEEMRLLACCVWYPFIEPILLGLLTASNVQALVARSSFLFRDALIRLHTREMAPQDWTLRMLDLVKRECEGKEAAGRLTTTRMPHPITRLAPLPLIPSFLLLASVLASYNPARLDVRYFVRDDSALLPGSGRNGRKRRSYRQAKGAGLNRQEMLGPKTFTLDRLYSIFQALLTEAGPELDIWADEDVAHARSDWWEVRSKSIGVTDAVCSLIRLNALVRTSAAEKLDSTSLLRANITFDIAKTISNRVMFDLNEWLWNWDP